MPIPDIPNPSPLATPEGDNETIPDNSLTPAAEVDLEIPPGNAPAPYDADPKPKGLGKFIDEVVRGEYM